MSCTNPNQTPLHTFRRGLATGLLRPSATALTATLLVTAAWFALCITTITPRWMADVNPRYLTTIPDDDYAYVTVQTQRMATSPPAPFAVLMLGNSALHAATSEPIVFEHAVQQPPAQPIPVHYLALKGLNPIHMAAMTELAPKPFRGVVLIQISQVQLAETADAQAELYTVPRIAVDSPMFDDELARVAGRPVTRTGVYFIDHWRFFAHRLNPNAVRHLFLGPSDYSPRYTAHLPQITRDDIEHHGQRLTKHLETYLTQRDRNRAIIDRIADRLRAAAPDGPLHIVLLERPGNPVVDDLVEQLNPDLVAEHRRYTNQWIADKNYHYWDLNRAANLTCDDFEDHAHIRWPESQDRYTRTLADRLAELVRDVYPTKGRDQ